MTPDFQMSIIWPIVVAYSSVSSALVSLPFSARHPFGTLFIVATVFCIDPTCP
ncbi:MAG TPA: hypothetical protein VIM10_18905 [Actinopolymorphaceae bacterium]|jgi:hypothetical protein